MTARTHDLGPLPLIHPRVLPMQKAETDLIGLVIEWKDRHGLTLAEELLLLASELHRTLSLAVRSERREK